MKILTPLMAAMILMLSACANENTSVKPTIDSAQLKSIKGVVPAALTANEKTSMKLSASRGVIYASSFLMADPTVSGTVGHAAKSGTDLFSKVIQNLNPANEASEVINQSKSVEGKYSYQVTGQASSHYDRIDSTNFNVSASSDLQVNVSQLVGHLDSTTVGPDVITGSLLGQVNGRVSSDKKFDIKLVVLADGRLSAKNTYESGSVDSTNTSYHNFAVAISLNNDVLDQIRQTKADPLGEAAGRDHRAEILEENISCQGTVTIEGKDFGCAEIIQAFLRS